jgi:sulfite reductase (ferredoxin)
MNFTFSNRRKKVVYQSYEIDTTDFDVAIPATLLEVPKVTIEDTALTKLGNNVIAQNKRVTYDRYQSAFRRFYTDKARLPN